MLFRSVEVRRRVGVIELGIRVRERLRSSSTRQQRRRAAGSGAARSLRTRPTASLLAQEPVDIVQRPSLGIAPTLSEKSWRRGLLVRLLPVLGSTVVYDRRPSLYSRSGRR